MSEDYEIVQRPSRKTHLLFATAEFPIEVICASADTGNAVRIYIKDADEKTVSSGKNSPVRPDGKAKGKRWTRRSRVVDLIREALKRRGYSMEWSRDTTSSDHILVWAVRREEG